MEHVCGLLEVKLVQNINCLTVCGPLIFFTPPYQRQTTETQEILNGRTQQDWACTLRL